MYTVNLSQTYRLSVDFTTGEMENYDFKAKFSNVGKDATMELNENGLVWNATKIAPYLRAYKWNEDWNSGRFSSCCFELGLLLADF